MPIETAEPGFYARRAIPAEVYHLEIRTYPTHKVYRWRMWIVGSGRDLEVPTDEMLRMWRSCGDFERIGEGF